MAELISENAICLICLDLVDFTKARHYLCQDCNYKAIFHDACQEAHNNHTGGTCLICRKKPILIDNIFIINDEYFEDIMLIASFVLWFSERTMLVTKQIHKWIENIVSLLHVIHPYNILTFVFMLFMYLEC